MHLLIAVLAVLFLVLAVVMMILPMLKNGALFFVKFLVCYIIVRTMLTGITIPWALLKSDVVKHYAMSTLNSTCEYFGIEL